MNKKNLSLLRALYCIFLLQAALLVLIYETEMLPVGTQAYDSKANYLVEMSGLLLTIICIPLALKLMNFSWVKKMLRQQPQKYLLLCIIRLGLLGVPLLFDVLAYYLLGLDATLGYLALMIVVAFLFIWPSQEKMEYECNSTTNPSSTQE